MKTLLKTLGKGILTLVPSLAGAAVSAATAAPAAGVPGVLISLIGAVMNRVMDAQANYPPEAKAAKHAEVVKSIGLITDVAVPLLEPLTGRDIDESRLRAGLTQIMEGVLDVLKSIGVIPITSGAVNK